MGGFAALCCFDRFHRGTAFAAREGASLAAGDGAAGDSRREQRLRPLALFHAILPLPCGSLPNTSSDSNAPSARSWIGMFSIPSPCLRTKFMATTHETCFPASFAQDHPFDPMDSRLNLTSLFKAQCLSLLLPNRPLLPHSPPRIPSPRQLHIVTFAPILFSVYCRFPHSTLYVALLASVNIPSPTRMLPHV